MTERGEDSPAAEGPHVNTLEQSAKHHGLDCTVVATGGPIRISFNSGRNLNTQLLKTSTHRVQDH